MVKKKSSKKILNIFIAINIILLLISSVFAFVTPTFETAFDLPSPEEIIQVPPNINIPSGCPSDITPERCYQLYFEEGCNGVSSCIRDRVNSAPLKYRHHSFFDHSARPCEDRLYMKESTRDFLGIEFTSMSGDLSASGFNPTFNLDDNGNAVSFNRDNIGCSASGYDKEGNKYFGISEVRTGTDTISYIWGVKADYRTVNPIEQITVEMISNPNLKEATLQQIELRLNSQRDIVGVVDVYAWLENPVIFPIDISKTEVAIRQGDNSVFLNLPTDLFTIDYNLIIQVVHSANTFSSTRTGMKLAQPLIQRVQVVPLPIWQYRGIGVSCPINYIPYRDNEDYICLQEVAANKQLSCEFMVAPVSVAPIDVYDSNNNLIYAQGELMPWTCTSTGMYAEPIFQINVGPEDCSTDQVYNADLRACVNFIVETRFLQCQTETDCYNPCPSQMTISCNSENKCEKTAGDCLSPVLPDESDELKALLRELGLPDDATYEQILEALAKRDADIQNACANRDPTLCPNGIAPTETKTVIKTEIVERETVVTRDKLVTQPAEVKIVKVEQNPPKELKVSGFTKVSNFLFSLKALALLFLLSLLSLLLVRFKK